MRMFKLGKRKGIKERKSALIDQISRLKTQLTNIKRQDRDYYSYASLKTEENTVSSYSLGDACDD
jgi:hypothetical protein